MKLEDFIPFMGHSSIYLPFDDFLTSHGIKWRPSLKRNLDDTYFIKGKGLVISFTISAEEDGILKKSEGTFILERVSATLKEEGAGEYHASLPFGIELSDTRVDVQKKLGEPKRRAEELDNYVMLGLVWTFAYLGSDKDSKLDFVRINVLDDGWRRRGIC